MKYVFPLLIAVFSGLVFAQESLILIKDLGKERFEVPVIDIIDNTHFIVLAKQEDLNLLNDKRISYSLLDDDVNGKRYYIVYPFKDDPNIRVTYDRGVFEKYGSVLAALDSCLIMQSTAEILWSIREYGTHLDYIELESMDLHANSTIIDTRGPARFDPIIEEMLQRVNKDSVEKFERDLAAIHNRNASEKWNKDEMVPYVKGKLKAYGCDSIIEFPMSGYTGTVFAGVRKGIKDPSIKKFCLLGGHPDTKISSGGTNIRHEGGNDNATGTVGFLEACRVHQYYKFDYTILYIGFNAEEKGLVGSGIIMRALKDAGCSIVGGGFSYDMYGMSKSKLSFTVYDGLNGSKEFVEKVKEIIDLYKIGTSSDFEVKTQSNTSISSDPSNIWKNGFVCAGHNFATTGAGQIHTTADIITSSYDKEHQARCLKPGLATVAYYAVPQKPTGIRNNAQRAVGATVRCLHTADRSTVFGINGNPAGISTITIYDLKGKMLRRLALDHSVSKANTVLWDGKNMQNTDVAGNSVCIVRYDNNGTGYSFIIQRL